MATITQTIPQYSLGMSEQPDQLKFPGQVTEITNGIPDLTKGLFKRPGARRIGADKLTDVQSGGSWFHYFRDETEGSYIGQVAADGQVRVWSCKTGAKMTTLYGPDPEWDSTKNYTSGQRVEANDKVYEAQATISSGGSAPSHSSGTTNNWLFIEATSVDQIPIQNYLQTATPENLQFLTINDTTFVNNRDISDYTQAEINGGGTPAGKNAGDARTVTTVGTTGTTDSAPHTHYGFIELLRTENGRQYGVNINNGTAVTTLTRATKIKITDHSLDESDGSGHCPGIGTEVYAVTAKSSYGASENITNVKNSSGTVLTETSNKKNLTFRVTALGQQGVSPNYSASQNGPGGNNYRCSYNVESVLLHGGEGWAVGDVVRIIPEHASEADSSDSQAYIDVTVTEIETTEVNATISSNGDGLIRPAPTPFAADTAVTADTIIGGIIAGLPSGVTGQHIGTGIYLHSTNPFSVEVVEEDLMRCFQTSVNDVQNLPNQCKNGYIVKIANSRMSDEDDYYLRFDGANNRDGNGSWSECAKGGIAKTLTNMPLVIQRTDTTTFTVRQFDYAERGVGDDTTNPMPSFVGSRINKVLFFRNRLALLSGENVITSRPGTLGTPDFFVETALTVSAADPVDISAASMFPSELFDGIEVNTGLVVFSTNQQFLLAADDTVFNPDTAKLRSISTFNYNETIPPISLGTTLAYVDNSGKFSRFNEMANIQREGEPNIVEVTKVVPTLLPKDIDLLTNSRENSIILLGKTGSDDVFGYKYFQVSEQRQQAAWFKWKLNNPLVYHFIINDEYFFLDSDYYLQSIKLVQTETDPSIVQDNVDFLLHVDNYTTVSGGSFNPATNITTFSSVAWLNTVTTPNHDLVVIDTNTNSVRVGRYAKPTVSGTSFTVPGNWSGATLTIGYIYPYEVKFPTFYATRQQGNSTRADVNSSLVLHRIKFHFGKIGLYETTLERVGKTDYTEIYESTQLDEYKVSDAPYLEEFIKTIPVYEKNTNVDITLRSSHPAPATLRAVSWEGDFSPMFYKRV
tara:strand:- start:32 stop:3115 length:3084 start_codon:yes stop_codon:yes gene_type:complete